MRLRWARLVRAAAANPSSLGFVKVDGALRGLAKQLDVDHVTLARNLRTWQERESPLVEGAAVRYGSGESLGLIQVPLLTDWLLWVAEQRASNYATEREYLPDSLMRGLVKMMAAHGLPSPGILGKQEAYRLLYGGSQYQRTFYGPNHPLVRHLAALRAARRALWRKRWEKRRQLLGG